MSRQKYTNENSLRVALEDFRSISSNSWCRVSSLVTLTLNFGNTSSKKASRQSLFGFNYVGASTATPKWQVES